MLTLEDVMRQLSNIVEYGSNANGEYIKFGNGVLIQWGSHSGTITIPNALMGGFRSGGSSVGVHTLPVPFLNTSYSLELTVSGLSAFGAVHGTKNTTDFDVLWTAVTSQGSAVRSVDWQAIGRWK
jgi:hypothetical protein